MTHSNEVLLRMQRTSGGPGWRWQEARRCAAEPARSPAWLDDLGRRAADFLTSREQGPHGEERAARKHPQIAAAFRLWQDERAVEHVKIGALADCPCETIARRLGVDEDTIHTAEALFFDVRPCLGARGWIACSVILPATTAGLGGLATRLKLAYYGGPVAAEALLEAQVRLAADEAERLFDLDVLLHAKLQEALDAPFESDRERTEFLKLSLDYQVRRAELELETRKFSHRCVQDRRAHKLELLRLKSAAAVRDIPPPARAAEPAAAPAADSAAGVTEPPGEGTGEKDSFAPAGPDTADEQSDEQGGADALRRSADRGVRARDIIARHRPPLAA